jgi:uncharacterized protein
MPDTPSSKAPPPVQLSLDRDGNWFHDGEPILHPQLKRLLDRSITVCEDGRVEVQVGNGARMERAFVSVEDLPYQVRDVEVLATGAVKVILNDESDEEIAPDALWIVGEDALYCHVKGGRFAARFLRQPYIRVASRFEEDGEGGFVLPLAGKRWAIARQDDAPVWEQVPDPAPA